MFSFFFQAEDGIRDGHVTGVQTCALPICFHQMNGQLEGIGERRMQADAHVQWMEYHDAIGKILAEIRIEDNLAGMRADFVALSGLLIDAVYDYGIPGVIYHQYCPMEDASWLSRDDQIENPYSPETMPTCGELIERIDL